METSKAQCVVMAALMIMAGCLILNVEKVSGDCAGKIPELASQCKEFVKKEGPKIPPSQACCRVVKNVDFPCVCKFVTKEVEKLISMEKVVYVGRTCGLTIKPGTKCGSYTVPHHLA